MNSFGIDLFDSNFVNQYHTHINIIFFKFQFSTKVIILCYARHVLEKNLSLTYSMKECVAVFIDNCPSKDPILSDTRAYPHPDEEKINQTCETVSFFLYNPIKTATHSLVGYLSWTVFSMSLVHKPCRLKGPLTQGMISFILPVV